MNPIFAMMPITVFEEMSALSRAHDAINLGQGFPDGAGPADVLAAAADALLTESNQYPPSMGLPALRAAAAEHYRRLQQLDFAAEDVLVTSGATEALAAALLAVVSPGDEVILLEPAYDAYRPLVLRAGGVPCAVTLHPPHWRLPLDRIAAAVTPRTRAILLNNPANPAARVFDADELAGLATLCVAHDLVAICDEVWEHQRFDGRAHVPLIGLPGMDARTVKIGSAGKMFALTGWKVGLAIARPHLLGPVARAHQFLAFSTPPNLQAGVAYALGKAADWFQAQADDLQRARDRLAGALAAAGFAVLPGEGTYFLNVDLHASGLAGDDIALAHAMVTQAGVAAIPLSAFCTGGDAPQGFVRLCFAKADAVLDEAADRLGRWRRGVLAA